ncbi:MAG: hypothetical protein WC614_08930 [bacterium]
MKNKITLLLIGLLISALFPATGKTENIGLKIPQMFCFSESFSNYKSSGNTFSIKNGEWQGESFEDTPSGGFAAHTLESFGSLIGGVIGSVPGLFFLSYAIGASGMENYGDILPSMGLCVATSLIGIPLGSAAGTNLAGNIMHQESSFRKAYRGALTGGLIAWGASAVILTALYIPYAGRYAPLVGISCTFPAIIPGCIIGSVIGYNK